MFFFCWNVFVLNKNRQTGQQFCKSTTREALCFRKKQRIIEKQLKQVAHFSWVSHFCKKLKLKPVLSTTLTTNLTYFFLFCIYGFVQENIKSLFLFTATWKGSKLENFRKTKNLAFMSFFLLVFFGFCV